MSTEDPATRQSARADTPLMLFESSSSSPSRTNVHRRQSPSGGVQLGAQHYLCILYLCCIVAFAVYTSGVTVTAVASVSVVMLVEFGLLAWMAVSTGVKTSILISELTLGASLTAFTLLLLIVVAFAACTGATLFNALLFLSSFVAMNPQSVEILRKDVKELLVNYIVISMIPAPLRKFFIGETNTDKTLSNIWTDLNEGGVSDSSIYTLVGTVAASVLLFLGVIFCFLVVLCVNLVLLSHAKYASAPRTTMLIGGGVGIMATLVGAVGLVSNGGSNNACLLFAFTSILDFATLLIVGFNYANARTPKTFRRSLLFSYLSTVLRLGAPHWAFLPELPSTLSFTILAIRTGAVAIGGYSFAHPDAFRQHISTSRPGPAAQTGGDEEEEAAGV